MKYLLHALMILFPLANYPFTWRSLNPFAEEIVEQITSKEYPCLAQATIAVEGEGSIEVNTWKHARVMVQTRKTGTREQLQYTTMNMTPDQNHMTMTSSFPAQQRPAQMHYMIMIPETAVLKVTLSGTIRVMNTHAPVYAHSREGNIRVIGSQGTVHARAPQGKVTVKQRSLPAESSIFIHAKNRVKLALSRSHNATIHAKAPQGITCDLFVTIDPVITKINKDMWQRLMRDINLTLGDGGPSVVIESTQRDIAIIEC